MPTRLTAGSVTIPEGSHYNNDVTPCTASLRVCFTHMFTHPVEKVQGFAGVQAVAEGDEDSGVGSPNRASSQARGPKPAHHHEDGRRKGRKGRRGKERPQTAGTRRKSRVSESKGDREVKKSKQRETERERERQGQRRT